jgi:hypothetical protein
MFGSVVAVAFQITFRAEIYANDVFQIIFENVVCTAFPIGFLIGNMFNLETKQEKQTCSGD